MNQSSHLYQLQRIDTELDKVQAQLLEIQAALSSNERIRAAKEQEESTRISLLQARQNLRSSEEMVKSVQTKINLSEAALYGGKIKNPKELQDLQSEIASLKKRLASLEDQQLEFMLAVEKIEADYQDIVERLNKTLAEDVASKVQLQSEQSTLQKLIDKLQAERKAALDSISPENIATYERLRKQKHGVAVSAIDDNGCTVCGSSLRPVEKQAARSPDQMAFCSSCGRILFAG